MLLCNMVPERCRFGHIEFETLQQRLNKLLRRVDQVLLFTSGGDPFCHYSACSQVFEEPVARCTARCIEVLHIGLEVASLQKQEFLGL